MKIALVNFSKKYDGVAICTDIYYHKLIDLGYEVGWYQFSDWYESDDYMNRPTVLKASRVPIRSFRVGYDRLITVPRLASEIKEQHVFVADPTLIRLGLKRKNFMVKVHDLIPLSKFYDVFSSRIMFKYALPKIDRATAVIATTEFMKGRLREYVSDADKIRVVPDPVLINPDEHHIERSILKMENGKINVLYVAADRPYKNIAMFIDVAAQFQKKKYENFTFTLVSELKEETLEKLKTANLQNIVVLKNLPNLTEVYNNCDIFLNVSMQEGFGRPMIEAMALGIPVIASKIEPFTEIIGDSGTLLDRYDVTAWEDAILRLTDSRKYSELAGNALSRFREGFSEDIFESKFKNAIEYFFENSIASSGSTDG